MTTREGSQGWKANFRLSRDILVNSITDTDGIRSNVRTDDHGNKFLMGFTLSIPPESSEQALIIAKEKGNKVADWLSCIHNLPVEAFLLDMTETRPHGMVRVLLNGLNFGCGFHEPKSIDLDFIGIERLFENNDVKALRQIAHYRVGLRYSSDPINQFREFYLVIEDQYDKNDPLLRQYNYVRHALNHPDLNYPSFAKQLLSDLKVNYIDPSSPEAKRLVEDKLRSLKQEATLIITGILGTI